MSQSHLELAGAAEVILITLLSFVLALVAAILSVVATMFVSYLLALGDGGMILTAVVAPVAAGWTFLYSFKRLDAYMSS
jgi:hypothetical protein